MKATIDHIDLMGAGQVVQWHPSRGADPGMHQFYPPKLDERLKAEELTDCMLEVTIPTSTRNTLNQINPT